MATLFRSASKMITVAPKEVSKPEFDVSRREHATNVMTYEVTIKRHSNQLFPPKMNADAGMNEIGQVNVE